MSIFAEHAPLKHKFKAFQGFKAHLSASQSIGDRTFTRVNLDIEEFDDFGEFDPTTHIATITKDARYLLMGMAHWTDMGNATDVEAAIRINGTGLFYYFVGDGSRGGNVYVSMFPSGVIDLKAGDTVDLAVYQNSGAAKTIYGNPNFWITYLLGVRV